MPNTSASGGYLVPGTTQGLPGGLTLNQFINTVLVGMSGLSGTLVRPKWQQNPPKQPSNEINWMAFGVQIFDADQNAFVGKTEDDKSYFLRQENLEVQCSFYGPLAEHYAALVRDGFQLQQNVEALTLANMGYGSIGPMQHVPDLVNEVWINRIEMSIQLRRQVQRTYPILPIAAADGTIYTVLGSEDYLQTWNVEED